MIMRVAGGSLLDVQALEGRSSVNTTKGYTEVHLDATRHVAEVW